MVDDKKHIRFADWSATDVRSFHESSSLVVHAYDRLKACSSFADRSPEQIFIPHVEAGYLFSQSLREGLHPQEEQMVSSRAVSLDSESNGDRSHAARLIKIKEWVDKNDPGAILIPFSGAFENKFLDMEDAERAKYVEEQKATRYVEQPVIRSNAAPVSFALPRNGGIRRFNIRERLSLYLQMKGSRERETRRTRKWQSAGTALPNHVRG